MQLFSAFDICGGCRKLNSSYDDDVGGCLPLTRRRTSERQGRRTGLLPWVRITVLVLIVVMLLLLVLCLGHPEAQVSSSLLMDHTLYKGSES